MDKLLQRELDDAGSILKDVTLIGFDGGRVMATKAILAIQSPVFRRMFYEHRAILGFGCGSVDMKYTTQVLQIVVVFCYTCKVKWTSFPDEWLSKKAVVTLIELRDAANYLELPTLREDIEIILKTKCDVRAFTILEELMFRGETDGELWLCIMKMLETNFIVRELNSSFFLGISGISIALIETIFWSLKEAIPGGSTVGLLKAWYGAHGSKLQKFADGVDLESFEPSKLALIQPCPLFPCERLHKAFVNIALRPSNRKRPRVKSEE